MKKRISKIILGILISFGFILILRFVLGGSEDSWICDQGHWIKHGNPRVPQPTGSCGGKEESPQIANPASVFCVEQGGRLEIKTATNGGQFGWCKFQDGAECEEWDFFRNKICGQIASSPAPAKNDF